jgi:aromatic-L-amino-acid decarboxylase
MTPDEFKAAGYAMVDRIAAYWEALQTRPSEMPIAASVKPGETFAALPAHPPEAGEAWAQIAADIDRVVMPGITHWQHPAFFGFFSSNISGPSVLAELLCAGLGVQGMLWATSPAATEVEMRMMDWLGEAIGLPPSFLFGNSPFTSSGGGVIQGTASEAALVAMVAARYRASKVAPRGPFVVYASTQAHSSITKSAVVAGIARHMDDREHIRLIEVDDELAMRPESLLREMKADLAAGRTPLLVVATVGTTSTTAIDSIAGITSAIDALTSPVRPWLHVDAAHAGAALVCPEFRPLAAGVEHADSFCFNPHKWLLTNFDCDCFWTRDRAALVNAMSITPEYLRNAASQSGEVIDYRDWQVPLGRRFRSLKLWFVLRHYGLEGLRAHIREHVKAAATFEALVRTDARFEVTSPRTMNLVCIALAPGPSETLETTNARTKALHHTLNASGTMLVTHTVLPNGRYVIRFAISGTFTREEHARQAWADVMKMATHLGN